MHAKHKIFNAIQRMDQMETLVLIAALQQEVNWSLKPKWMLEPLREASMSDWLSACADVRRRYED